MPLNFRQETAVFRPYVLLAVLVVLSLALVTCYAREGEDGVLHRAQDVTSGLFAPVKLVSGAISGAENGVAESIADMQAAPETLTALKQQNDELRETIAQLEEYRQEAQRLEGLIDLVDRYAMEGVSCRVLSRSTDSWNRMVTIDAGTASGVRAGLAVVGSSGLVGQVVSAGERTAEVRLLDDPATGIAALIQSNRAEGILHGSFDGLMYLDNVDSSVEVKAGDVVVTSGLGGGFYRGIMIGTVVKVDGAVGDTNRRIIVTPNDTTGPLEEVFVVTGMHSEGDADESLAASQTNANTNQSTVQDRGTTAGAADATSSAGTGGTQNESSVSGTQQQTTSNSETNLYDEDGDGINDFTGEPITGNEGQEDA